MMSSHRTEWERLRDSIFREEWSGTCGFYVQLILIAFGISIDTTFVLPGQHASGSVHTSMGLRNDLIGTLGTMKYGV